MMKLKLFISKLKLKFKSPAYLSETLLSIIKVTLDYTFFLSCIEIVILSMRIQLEKIDFSQLFFGLVHSTVAFITFSEFYVVSWKKG